MHGFPLPIRHPLVRLPREHWPRFGVPILALAMALALATSPGWAQPAAQPPNQARNSPQNQPAQDQLKGGPERLKLSTSDGVQLVAWYYPVAADAEATDAGAADAKPPVALLVHDLDGSHTSVEPLASALQKRRIAVVAPDLRGHGDSVGRLTPASVTEKMEPKQLKKPDFEAMARTGGGRVRDQATIRGDLEAVRGWIKRQGEAGTLDIDRLFVVGSGLGGAVALAWAVEDAKWPPIATGPQGRSIRGLALISPTWTTRGFSIQPALADDVIRRGLPILLVAGTEDRDTLKLFDQLKRQRPGEWYEKRANAPPESAAKGGATPPSLYLLQLNTPADRDRLASTIDASGRGNDPAALIAGFMTAVGAKAAD
jgi:pimeloyl-ACP methyl ester carboxylesterase